MNQKNTTGETSHLCLILKISCHHKIFKCTPEYVIFTAMGPISRIKTSQLYVELDGHGQTQLTTILKRHVKQLAMTCLFINSKTNSLYYSCFTNYVHSSALTRSLLPGIAPLSAGMFSTPTGLPWYHASIVSLLVSLFSTPTGLLAFIELLVVRFLLSIDLLPTGLFSTPVGFPCIMI